MADDKAGVGAPTDPWERDTDAPHELAPQGPVGEAVEQFGVGLTKSAVGAAGMAGDIRDKTIEAADNYFGMNGRLPRISQMLGPLMGSPNSAQLQAGVEGLTGKMPEPTGMVGEYARTAGEFFPAVFGGEAGLLPRIAKAMFPAFTSETAGQVTKGGPYESWARFMGALTPATMQFMWRQAPERMEQSVEHLFDSAKANYNHPDVKALQIKTPSVQAETMKIAQDLFNNGMREETSGGTTAALSELIFGPKSKSFMSNPVKAAAAGRRPRPSINVDDIQSVRTQLRNVAGNYNNPTDQKYAMDALQKVDEFMANLKQTDLLKGDASKALPRLNDAKGDYWAAKSLELLTDKLYAAEMRSGAAHSGQNLQNTVRQKIASILTDKKMRAKFTDRELEMMEQIDKGHPAENLMRRISKMLPRTGALGTALTLGSVESMGPAGLALPITGEVAASLESKIANKLIRNLQEEVVSRSPAGKAGYKPPRKLGADFATPGVLGRPEESKADPESLGAQQAPDGNWYLPDPDRPGKYLQVDPSGAEVAPGAGAPQ